MAISRREMFGSLVGVGALTGQGAGQDGEPAVLSGPDVGFRVESVGRDGVPTGTLVVRVGGKWVVPQFQAGVRKVT